MKRIPTSLAVVAGTILLAAPVSAGTDNGPPPGLDPDDLTYECTDGVDSTTATVHSGNGRSGWINGEQSILISIEATVDGQAVYSRTYGKGPRGHRIDCFAVDGPISVSITAVQVQ
jgi:hypothetical protein